MISKVTNLESAVGLIQDGDTITTSGFGGASFPEELVIGLERRSQPLPAKAGRFQND